MPYVSGSSYCSHLTVCGLQIYHWHVEVVILSTAKGGGDPKKLGLGVVDIVQKPRATQWGLGN